VAEGSARQVLVRYFAAAAEAAGVPEERLELAPDATVATLRELLSSRYGPAMERVLKSGSFLVDRVVSRDPSRPLGAQVDVLPPFSGG
jgi:molybdopterin synthase sulfur carrier subunit